MVLYECGCVLDGSAPWDDFFGPDGYRNFTITCRHYDTIPCVSKDGWVDVVVNAEGLTAEIAAKIIGDFIGEDVLVVGLGTCNSSPVGINHVSPC